MAQLRLKCCTTLMVEIEELHNIDGANCFRFGQTAMEPCTGNLDWSADSHVFFQESLSRHSYLPLFVCVYCRGISLPEVTVIFYYTCTYSHLYLLIYLTLPLENIFWLKAIMGHILYREAFLKLQHNIEFYAPGSNIWGHFLF